MIVSDGLISIINSGEGISAMVLTRSPISLVRRVKTCRSEVIRRDILYCVIYDELVIATVLALPI